jgi:hypothetical protein
VAQLLIAAVERIKALVLHVEALTLQGDLCDQLAQGLDLVAQRIDLVTLLRHRRLDALRGAAQPERHHRAARQNADYLGHLEGDIERDLAHFQQPNRWPVKLCTRRSPTSAGPAKRGLVLVFDA